MLFNSFIFVGFLILTFIIYYLPNFKKHQIIVLVGGSLIFYAYYKPILLGILIGSLSFNALASYWIYFGPQHQKKLTAVAGVVANLALLCFYKYGPLIGVTFLPDGNSISAFLLDIPLPIGISFFTFEGISLLIDTFKDDKNKERHIEIPRNFFLHWRNTALFITFFPHLVAGPILKAYEYFPQIKEKNLKDIHWEKAFRLIVLGYFLKMVIADNIKEQTIYMCFPQFLSLPSGTLVAMLFGYSIQIFADFAGYSFIALGLAQLFGYMLNPNFDYPYISSSFAEFWKRWHISLSTFLREYLYFPLGGNRKGKIRTYLNLLVVMVLGGLWHGAAWSYAAWGLAHGLALAIERLIKDYFVFKRTNLVSILSGMFVFSYVSLAWLMFRFPNFSHVIAYLKAIASNIDMARNDFWHGIIAYNVIYSLPVLLYYIYYLYKQNSKVNIVKPYEHLLYAAMLFMIIINSGPSGDFIYFQF